MRCTKPIGLALLLIFGGSGCSEDKPAKAERPPKIRPRAAPVPTASEPPPAPSPSEPAVPQPTLVPAAPSQWWCLCYSREGAEGPEPVTACREDAEQCRKLEGRIAKGSDEIIAGSLSQGCRLLTGDHPGDVAGTREQWQPSKLRGAWVAEGACLLGGAVAPELVPEPSEAPPAEVEADPFALMGTELIGNLAVGQSSAEIRKRHGEAQSTGAIQEEPATGSWLQDWTYADGLVLTMKSTTRSGPQSVGAVTISAPSTLRTRRNVGIGDSREAVERAYGDVAAEDWEQSADSFVAGSVYGGLFFTFEDGAVTRIFLGAGAE